MLKFCPAKLLLVFNKGGLIASIILTCLFLFSCDNTNIRKPDHTAYVDMIREQANHMLDEKKGEKALAFFDSAYQAIDDPGIGDEVRKFSFKGQDYYHKMGDDYGAITRIDSIFYLLSDEDLKNKYIREYSNALFQKGDLLFNIKRYNDAYQYYYRGNIIAKTILDPCAVSEYTYRLGMVSYKQAKYAEAVNNFKQCFEDCAYCIKDFRNFAMGQELLANIALSYSKNGKTDSSLIYSNKALAFLNEEGKRFKDRKEYVEMAKAVIYGNQADEYSKKGDTLRAENLLQKSIATNLQKGFDMKDSQLSMIKLGEIYVATNRLQETLTIAGQLKSSLDSNYNLYADMGLKKLYWKYYDRNKKTELAYSFLQQYMLLKDSMERENKKLVTADIDKEFESIEQKYNYNTLSKANDLKKNYLYVALLFSLMALAIVLLLFNNWKSSKLNVAALTNLNNQVTFQNKQLEQTLEDLQQINQEKDKILKVVAHDLRNPLSAISAIASLLLEEVDFNDEQKELARIMKASSLHSIDMISDLLAADFSYRSEEMKKDVIDIQALLKECVEQLKFKADEKQQKIELEIGARILILGDKEKIWRVLSNLIVNAIKFSPLGSLIKAAILEKDQKMLLSVEDNGIGIPEALKGKVFDAFTDAKRRGTSGEQPFGLGLSISRQIIEAHSGRIWFDSEENKGTTFFIELPVTEQKQTLAMSPTLEI